METAVDTGIVNLRSRLPVDEAMERLKSIVARKGITLFAIIDHSKEAQAVGLTMPPTQLAIFGNPKAGTALMLAAPSSGIDLPLKILIWEDAEGEVWVTYNNPQYLGERHGLPLEFLRNLGAAASIAAVTAENED